MDVGYGAKVAAPTPEVEGRTNIQEAPTPEVEGKLQNSKAYWSLLRSNLQEAVRRTDPTSYWNLVRARLEGTQG